MIKIKKVSGDSFRFQLKNASGTTLLESISFSEEKTAKRSAAALPSLIDQPGVFERKTDHTGKFLFNIKDTEGKIIGSSPLFYSEAGMENGIRNVVKHLMMHSGTDL